MQEYQMIENLNKIFNYFGLKQKEKLQEECHEYIEDMNEKEAADVWIVATQLYLNSPKMREAVKCKIDRTLKRIEQNYYDKETGKKATSVIPTS